MTNSLFNRSLLAVYKAILLLYFIFCSINTHAQTPSTPSAWSSVSNGVWTLNWSTPAGTITSYRIHNWDTDGDTSVSAGVNSMTINKSGDFSVAACNGASCSVSSSIIRFTIPVSSASVLSSSSSQPSSSTPPASSSSTPALPVPSKPATATQIADSNSNPNKFLISWGDVGANHYVLEYSASNDTNTIGTNWVYSKTVSSSSTSVERGNVSVNDFYRWRIKACNANSQCSDWVYTRNSTFPYGNTPSATSLIGPASGSTVNTQPCFNWQPDSVATGFAVTVSTSTDFPDMRWAVNLGAGASSACFNSLWGKKGANPGDIGSANLVVGQTYYWRVVSLMPTGSGYGFTETRSFTVSNIPGAPTLDAKVINNSYWQLEWDKPDETVTRYELTEINSGVTRKISLLDVASYKPTVLGLTSYTIAACNSHGCGLDSNIKSFVIEAVPGAPLINASTDVYSQVFSLSWSNVGAAKYELQLKGAPNQGGLDAVEWQPVSKDSSLSKTISMASLQAYTYLLWRVRACSSSDICSAWQLSRIKINQFNPLSGGANLIAPASGSIVSNTLGAPCFEWQADASAAHYVVTVSNTTEFTEKRWAITVTSDTRVCWNNGWPKVGPYANELSNQLSHSTTYYWRVVSVSPDGRNGFSPARTFSLSSVPGIPTLTATLTNDKKSWLLQWIRPVGNVFKYILEEDNTNEAGSRWVENYSPLETDVSFVSTLKGETKYQISACNAQNQCSLPSNVVTTLLESEPLAPAQLSVAQNIELQGFNLEWPAVNGATKYKIQYLAADTADEVKASSNWTAVGDTNVVNYFFAGAIAYKHYKWRVSACKQSGVCSGWVESPVKLLQQKPTLGSPVLLSPANGVQTYINNINYPCFRWSLTTEDEARTITKYVVTISTVPDFVDRRWYFEVPVSSGQSICWGNGIGWTKGGIYPELLPAQLQEGATYYWRVVAVNTANELGFSETRTFTLSYNASTTPSEPSTSISSQIFEAESASKLFGASISTAYQGFSGAGFGDFFSGVGCYIEWTVPSTSASQAILSIRYANGTGDLRPADIFVNGAKIASHNMEYTGGWDKWKFIHFTVPLNAGNNIIQVKSTSSVSGGAGNIDYIQISKGAVLHPELLGVPDVSVASTSDGKSLRMDWQAPSPSGDISYYQIQQSEPFGGLYSVASNSFIVPNVYSATYQIRACKADNTCGVFSAPVFISNSTYGAEVASQKIKSRIVNNIPGYQGTGYAEFENTGYLEWNVYRSYAESGILIVTYINTSGTANVVTITNNSNAAGTISLPPTAGNTWSKVAVPVSLTAGNNFVRFLPASPAANVYIDQINVQTRTPNSPGVTPPDSSVSNLIFNIPESDPDGNFTISWNGARTFGELYERSYGAQSQAVTGLKGKYYGYQQSLNGNINLSNLTQATSIIAAQQPDAEFIATTLNYKSASDLGWGTNLQTFLGADQSSLTKDPGNTTDAIILLTGKINLAAGTYRFRVKADDGHRIKINGSVVSEYNGNTTAILREGSLFAITNSGEQDIEIVYWDSGSTNELGIELMNQGVTNYAYVGGSILSHYPPLPPAETLLKRGEGPGSYSYSVTGKVAGTYFYLFKDCYQSSANATPECNIIERPVVVGSIDGSNSSASSSNSSSNSSASIFNFDTEAPAEFKSALGISILPNLGQAQLVAVTQGKLAVNNGAAAYSVDIDLPPAVRDLKPKLALTYNSQSGNGLLGVGWSLSGLSAITRCRANFATEGAEAQKSNPRYTMGDRLCLDGQKLVIASPSTPKNDSDYWATGYWPNGTEYKTELDNFARIAAYGSSANGGHGYFKVWTKDGRVLTYGAEENSQNSKIYAPNQEAGPIKAWALDKVEDAYGNSYSVTYERNTESGEYYPQQINLGATGLVVFTYQPRAGKAPWGYDAGNKYQYTKLLSKVTTYVGIDQTIPVKQYDIRYKTSPTTNRELIDELYECGYELFNWKCAKPLTFGWQAGELGFESTLQPVQMTDNSAASGSPSFEDIDGDGYVDMVGKVTVLAWGTSSGKFRPSGYDVSRVRDDIADINFDSLNILNSRVGKVGIVSKRRWIYGEQKEYIDIFLARFDSTKTTVDYTLLHSLQSSTAVVMSGDFNNDGLDDFLFDDFIWLQNPSSSSPQFVKSSAAGASIKGVEPAIIDFNNDGLNDLTYVATRPFTYVSDLNYTNNFLGHVNKNTHFDTDSAIWTFASPTLVGQMPMDPTGRKMPSPGMYRALLDFNGDGIKDYLYQHFNFSLATNPYQYPDHWYVKMGTGDNGTSYLGEGVNTGIPVTSLFNIEVADGIRFSVQYSFQYDYNKDGVDDIILLKPISPGQARWRVHYADYNNDQFKLIDSGVDPFHGRADYLTTMPVAGLMDNMFRGDINNDGLLDIIFSVSTYDFPSRYMYYAAKQQQPDLLNVITDGFGAITTLDYSPLTGDTNNGSPLYTPDTVAPVFPLAPVSRGMQVVKKVSASDGQNGFNHIYFNYVGGVRDIFRGFSGFKSITTTNASTNTVSTAEYRQDWPYTGRIKKQTVKDTSGKLISVIDNSYALHPENSRFPYLNYSLQKNYTLSTTSENAPLNAIKSMNTFDVCGNLIEQTTKIGSGFNGVDVTGELSSQLTTNIYDYYTTPVCNDDFLIRSEQQVTKTGSSNLKHAVTEFIPNSQRDIKTRTDFKGESIEVSVTYDREANGVVNKITEIAKDIDGNDRPARVTTMSDFAYGIYPQVVKNAENHQTSFTYDYRFGSVKTQTFLGLSVISTYDALGRTQSEQAVDGTLTENIPFYCTSAPVTCPGGAVYGVASRVTNGSSSQQGILGEPLRIVFYDVLQRELRNVVYSLNGKVINQASEYFSNGFPARISEPYTTSGIVADTSLATGWTSFNGYDALGRVMTITGADGGSKTTTYSTDGYGFKTTESILVIKPTGGTDTQITSNWTNALGQKVRVEDALFNTVSYSYDATGNLESTQVNNNAATKIDMEHDVAGNKIYIKDPDAGEIYFDYNGFGELRKQTWQKNVLGVEKYITYDYDKLGRQIGRVDKPASGNTVSYSWVWDTRQQGQLSSRSGNGFSEEYFYDGFSRLSRQITAANGLNGGEFTYTYDNFSRPETVKYPNGFKIRRDYNNVGYQVQTTDITSAILPRVLWTLGRTVDARGAFTNQLWGNGVVTQTGFDASSGRLASIKSGRLSSTNNLNNLHGDIQNLSYTFDTLGNLYSRTTARTNNTGVALENITENYGYDKLNRVKTITTSSLFGRTQTFEYDAGGLGNLVNRSDMLTGNSFNNDVGELKYERVRKAGIHAVTSTGNTLYSYDDYGNMVVRGGESIIYDTFNKPVRIAGTSITDFYYDPDHELYKEVSGTKTTYKLAGGSYEVIVEGSTTTQKSYVDGVILNNRTLTNGTQSANDTVYLHTDHLGSVEATTNALGQFVNRMSFGAWGERQKSDWKPGTPTETLLTSNGFTGHDQLDSHNLVHMGGRVYDPNLGRFLSADLFVQSPYDSQSYNRYSYTFNNPLSYTDPTGYMSDMFNYMMDISYHQAISWSWATMFSHNKAYQYDWREVNGELTLTAIKTDQSTIDSARNFFMGRDFSGNTLEQNQALCSRGANGACSTATQQLFELGAPGLPRWDMGPTVLGVLQEGLERGVTRGFGNGTTAVKDAKNAKDALKTAEAAKDAAAKAKEPPITQVDPRNLIPTQTRNEMSGSQIKRLEKSMKQNGYDQNKPVDAWKRPDGRLEIQNGHHRTEAAKRAGLDNVPVRVWE